MNDAAKKRPSRWGLIVPWALFALIAAAWFGFWHVLKDQAIARIDAALDAQRAAGVEARYGAVTADGFPLRLSLRFADLAYAPADGAWRASVPAASAHVNLTNPLHLIATADAPVRLAGGDGVAHVFTAARAALSVRIDTTGAVQRISLDLGDLGIAREGEAAPGSRVASLVAHLRPDARDPARLQLALDAAGLRLARPARRFEAFGQDVAELHLRGGLDAAAAKDPLAALAGGAVRVEGLGVKWGPLDATGQGALGLDTERRPDGALDLTIADPGAVLAALDLPELAAAAPPGQPVTLPLEARGGVLRLGPVALRELQPVF